MPSAQANESNNIPPDREEAQRSFDGVVCFGGVDWWYHNRGHYDLQMMRELSASVPVLYVNSIGMRTPRLGEGTMFAKRVLRKLKSLARGLQRINPGFYVYSARTPPGAATSSEFFSRLLAYQVRQRMRKIGIERPLLWIACPPAAPMLERLDAVATVYQRTDRMERFHGVDYEYISSLDQMLKSRADLTVFCASALYDSEKSTCREALFVDHGVDFQRFADAAPRHDEAGFVPEDLRCIPSPRVGFVGGIDDHTFDAALFLDAAARLPGFQFVMVGACSLPDGWCELENVHFLGQKPYEDVPAYMAGCDVLIMPWNQNDWIEVCNPVKLKEYLATGRPVVSTPFPELAQYVGHVAVASTAADFAQAIKDALAAKGDGDARRERVRLHTWERKAQKLLETLGDQGFYPRQTVADRNE